MGCCVELICGLLTPLLLLLLTFACVSATCPSHHLHVNRAKRKAEEQRAKERYAAYLKEKAARDKAKRELKKQMMLEAAAKDEAQRKAQEELKARQVS